MELEVYVERRTPAAAWPLRCAAMREDLRVDNVRCDEAGTGRWFVKGWEWITSGRSRDEALDVWQENVNNYEIKYFGEDAEKADPYDEG